VNRPVAARAPDPRSPRFASRGRRLEGQDGDMSADPRPIARVGGALAAAGIVWLAVRLADRTRRRSTGA
jgi:hypothetical protein